MFDDILCFVTAAREGSLTRAAEKLYITPTAAMKRVNALESALGGIPLFERTRRGVSLTEAGAHFLERAEFILGYLDKTTAEMRALARKSTGIIKVGHSLLNPADRLTDIWNSPGNKSDIKLEIVPFIDTVNALENIYHRFGEFFDVMIGSCDIKGYSAYFNILNIGYDRLNIALPRGHRLSDKDIIAPSDLVGERLLILQKGISGVLDAVRRYLENNYPGILLTDSEKYYDTGVFNRAEAENIPLVSLDYWGKVHSGLKNVPFDVDFLVPYGLMYPLTPSDVVKEFVTEVESLINIPEK